MNKSAFVVMPFAKAISINKTYKDLDKDNFDTIFDILQEFLQDFGYKAKRSDSASNIIREIIIELDNSELVIADLTGLNPNVMYELGIRHALCKKTILLSQDISEIPFDLKSYLCIQYKWINNVDRKQLKEDLKQTISKINSDIEQRFGPYHTYAEIKNNAIIENDEKILKGRINSLTWELIMYQQVISAVFKKLSNEIPAIKLVSQPVEGLSQYEIDYNNLKNSEIEIIKKSYDFIYSLPCCDKLLSDMYIPLKYNKYNDIDELVNYIRSIKNIQAYLKILDASNIDSTLPIDSLKEFIWRATYLVQKFNFVILLGIENVKISDLSMDTIDEIIEKHKNVS
jgi:hypothetical protein